jgi:hypothetical protein
MNVLVTQATRAIVVCDNNGHVMRTVPLDRFRTRSYADAAAYNEHTLR